MEARWSRSISQSYVKELRDEHRPANQPFRSWPLVIQFAIGLLILPVILGLWIWETSWPWLLRLILVLGLAWVTVYTFFPRGTASRTEASRTSSNSHSVV